ncbi:MAG: DUF3368 domain-containing protein [Chloroflexota bacterium]|nr:DUF3368 domain-containing protein [Chloroflexota bacterium]
MRVVSDAGPIIHLSWIDHLDLLDALFEEVLLPPAVREEVLAAPTGALGLERIAAALGQGWLRVHPLPIEATAELRLPMHGVLAQGEREAIVLAQTLRADLLLTDDGRARAVAEGRGLEVTGTLGILRAAREEGRLTAILPLVEELRRHGQWLSAGLIERIRSEERR